MFEMLQLVGESRRSAAFGSIGELAYNVNPNTQLQNGSASDRFQLTRHSIDVEIGRWRSRSVVECVRSRKLFPKSLTLVDASL